MNKLENIFSILKHYWPYFLFGILLATLFSVLIKQSSTTITIKLFANQDSIMSVISSGTVINTAYQAGHSTKKFTIKTKSTKRPLRLDPSSGTVQTEDGSLKEQSITIDSISIAYLGDEITISGSDLFKHIVNVYEADLEQTGSSLTVKSKSEDPQIYFRNPRPSRPVAYIIFLYCAGLVLLCYMFRLDRMVQEKQGKKSDIFILFALPLCAGVYLSQSYAQLLLLSVLIITLLYVFIKTLNEIVCSSDIISSSKYLIPIIIFILIIFTGVFQTVTSSKFVDGLGRLSVYKKDGQRNIITLNSIKQFLISFEDHFSKSYFFRSELLNFNARIKLNVFNFSPTKKAILGKQEMFFEGHGERRIEENEVGYLDNISDYLGLLPFTDQELEQWRVTLEERYYWLKEQGIAYIFAIAPNKSQIYPEYYPDKINSIKASQETRRYDQLINYLRDTSIVPVVDLRNALLEVKAKVTAGTAPNHMLFYRTDGHWNAYGAFWAYRAIIEEINASYPNYTIPVVDINDFVIHEKKDMVHRPFMNMIGIKNETEFHDTFLTLFPRQNTLHAAQDEFVTQGININKRWPLEKNANKDGQIPFLFIAGDSFAFQMAGYFSIHTKRIGVGRFVNQFRTKLIEDLHPDIYIQEILNMYLLYKVPENPQTVKMARKRVMQNS